MIHWRWFDQAFWTRMAREMAELEKQKARARAAYARNKQREHAAA
jgi:hypothetical protein